MRSYKVTIPMLPKPKNSVKLGNGRFYSPTYKGTLMTRTLVKEQLPENSPLLTGPMLVICHFRIPAPAFVSPRRRKELHNTPHTKRPDGDNLEKFLNDAMNGILWEDDARISWLLRSKTTTSAKEGSTIIFVTEMSESTTDYDRIIAHITDHIELGDVA